MIFWAWWAGGAALATVAVGFLVASGRGLGVSGAFSAIIDADAWRAEKKRQALQSADGDALQAALRAATLAEFGEGALVGAPLANATPSPTIVAPRLGALASMWLLLGLVAGGAIAALQAGAWGSRTMGSAFVSLFGSGVSGYIVLVGGGFLVGAGTRLAGGCTSGHGLVGTARLQWPSVVSTAVFFGTAIAVSLVMEKLL